MQQFKVGDTVKRINSANGSFGAQLGQSATVIGIRDGIVRVVYGPRAKEESWFNINAELVHRHKPESLVDKLVEAKRVLLEKKAIHKEMLTKATEAWNEVLEADLVFKNCKLDFDTWVNEQAKEQ